MARADLDKRPDEVAAMFDEVAERYDITNDVLALGQTRLWRRAVVNAIRPAPGERVLDLAAGTGTSTAPLAARGAFAVPCDFSLGMLAVGKARQAERLRRSDGGPESQGVLPFVAGDALHLPFADGAFDAVTISFGLRNTADPVAALAEMRRVTRSGGRLVVCEFSHPVFGPFRTIYSRYLMGALPGIARRTASNPDAYVYLAESIRSWPDQPGLADWMAAAGWRDVAWLNLTGGIVALHRGRN